jgi:hypothetical protein
LSKAKEFLYKTKNDIIVAEMCDLVDENTNENQDKDKQMIEMNLMLFQNNSSNEENQSSDESSDNYETEDSEEESNESDDSNNIEDKEKTFVDK